MRGDFSYKAFLLSFVLLALLGSVPTRAQFSSGSIPNLSNISASSFKIPSKPPALQSGDIFAIVTYYLLFFVLPIILAILVSIVLCVSTCVTCCCQGCLCKGPMCLSKKWVLIGVYSGLFGAVIAGGIVAWVSHPKITNGIDIGFNTATKALTAVQTFANTANQSIYALKDELTKALIPGLAPNATSDGIMYNIALNQSLSDTLTLITDLQNLFTTTENTLTLIKSNLTYLKTAEGRYVPPNTVPDPNSLPSTGDYSSQIDPVKAIINNASYQSTVLGAELDKLRPDPAIKGYYNLQNFSLPFLPIDSIPKLDGEALLRAFGIADLVNSFNQTSLFSLPIDISSIQGIKSLVSSNSEYYGLAISVLVAVGVGIFTAWYPGVFTKSTCCLRVPLGASGFFVIVFGLGIGIHLALGTFTHDLCAQSDQLLLAGTQALKDQLQNQTFGNSNNNNNNNNTNSSFNAAQAAYNATLKILDAPQLLLYCSGNDTIFGLYDINIIRDFGFYDTLSGLNYSSLVDNLQSIPNSTTANIDIQPLVNQLKAMKNASNDLLDQRDDAVNKLRIMQVQLNSYPPQNASDAQQIKSYNDTIDNLISLFGDINTTLVDAKDKIDQLLLKIDDIMNLRYLVMSTLLQGIAFPNFNFATIQGIFQYLQDTFGQCSWIGDLYARGLIEALCNNISPGLNGVAHGTIAVALVMFFSLPVILWSFGLMDSDSSSDDNTDL